ncbi:MAG: hypothetical protein HY429_03745 [Candidatus Levybacteria bacterium]|nr:hypothetical protein [Candidatus Levybacteria bacterium]
MGKNLPNARPFLPAINLFKGRQQHLADKIINWALSVGRVIVIVAEAVALSAFLYRFSLDRELIDLNDKIEQRLAIVDRAKNTEGAFRNLQERLTVIKNLSASGKEVVSLMQVVYSLAPSGFVINDLSILEDKVKIDASVQSPLLITTFVKELKKYPSIINVSLDRIENKTSSAKIGIVLSAQLKQESKQKDKNK